MPRHHATRAARPRKKSKMDLSRLAPADRDAVQRALRLIRVVSPAHAEHILRSITGIRLDTGVCEPGAASCTGGVLESDLAFTTPPAEYDLLELAELLVHEGAHHGLNAQGGHGAGRDGIVQHAFTGRPSDAVAKKDPVYAEAARVRKLMERVAPDECPGCGLRH